MGNNSCNCTSRDHHFGLLKEFWGGLKLRSKTALVYNERIIESYKKENLKNEDIFRNKLMREFFINVSYEEKSIKLFEAALENYKESMDDFLIALIFLTMNDKGAVKVTFKKMLRYYKPEALVYKECSNSSKENKSQFTTQYTSESTNTNTFNISKELASEITTLKPSVTKLYIKSYMLFSILKILIELVTIFSISYLRDLSPDKEDFTFSLLEDFSEEYQREYLDHKLSQYGEDLICLDEFLENEYKTLSDDNAIRAEISFCHYSYNVTKNKK